MTATRNDGVFCDIMMELVNYPNTQPIFTSNSLNEDEMNYIEELTTSAISSSNVWLLDLFSSLLIIIQEMLDTHGDALNAKSDQAKISKKRVVKSDQNMQIESFSVAPLKFFRSDPFTINKSTFFASVAHVSNLEEVDQFLLFIKQSKECRDATHNIAGWCLPDGESGNDEDGEKSAGGKLQFVIDMSGYRGVAVVVTRFFGGILLGPVRFKIINECGMRAIDECFAKKQIEGIVKVIKKR